MERREDVKVNRGNYVATVVNTLDALPTHPVMMYISILHLFISKNLTLNWFYVAGFSLCSLLFNTGISFCTIVPPGKGSCFCPFLSNLPNFLHVHLAPLAAARIALHCVLGQVLAFRLVSSRILNDPHVSSIRLILFVSIPSSRLGLDLPLNLRIPSTHVTGVSLPSITTHTKRRNPVRPFLPLTSLLSSLLLEY